MSILRFSKEVQLVDCCRKYKKILNDLQSYILTVISTPRKKCFTNHSPSIWRNSDVA